MISNQITPVAGRPVLPPPDTPASGVAIAISDEVTTTKHASLTKEVVKTIAVKTWVMVWLAILAWMFIADFVYLFAAEDFSNQAKSINLAYVIHVFAWVAAVTAVLLLAVLHRPYSAPIVMLQFWSFMLFFSSLALHTASVTQDMWTHKPIVEASFVMLWMGVAAYFIGVHFLIWTSLQRVTILSGSMYFPVASAEKKSENQQKAPPLPIPRNEAGNPMETPRNNAALTSFPATPATPATATTAPSSAPVPVAAVEDKKDARPSETKLSFKDRMKQKLTRTPNKDPATEEKKGIKADEKKEDEQKKAGPPKKMRYRGKYDKTNDPRLDYYLEDKNRMEQITLVQGIWRGTKSRKQYKRIDVRKNAEAAKKVQDAKRELDGLKSKLCVTPKYLEGKGVQIVKIDVGCIRDQPAIKVGDIITSIDGMPTLAKMQFLAVAEGLKPGKTLKFNLLKANTNEPYTTKVCIGAAGKTKAELQTLERIASGTVVSGDLKPVKYPYTSKKGATGMQPNMNTSSFGGPISSTSSTSGFGGPSTQSNNSIQSNSNMNNNNSSRNNPNNNNSSSSMYGGGSNINNNSISLSGAPPVSSFSNPNNSNISSSSPGLSNNNNMNNSSSLFGAPPVSSTSSSFNPNKNNSSRNSGNTTRPLGSSSTKNDGGNNSSTGGFSIPPYNPANNKNNNGPTTQPSASSAFAPSSLGGAPPIGLSSSSSLSSSSNNNNHPSSGFSFQNPSSSSSSFSNTSLGGAPSLTGAKPNKPFAF